jgi:hypothetical protein
LVLPPQLRGGNVSSTKSLPLPRTTGLSATHTALHIPAACGSRARGAARRGAWD